MLIGFSVIPIISAQHKRLHECLAKPLYYGSPIKEMSADSFTTLDLSKKVIQVSRAVGLVLLAASCLSWPSRCRRTAHAYV